MTRRWATALDKLGAGLATVGLACNQYKYPIAWHRMISNHPWIEVLLLVLDTVFVVVTPARSLIARGQEPARLQVERRILNKLGELLDLALSIDKGLKLSDPALHLWVPRWVPKHPFSRRLRRIGTYRLGGGVVNVGFHPKKGEGVAGLCWRHNTPFSKNVEELRATVTTRSAFARLRDNQGDAVMNMTWEDFEKTKHRGAIFASPIRGPHGRFRGCLTFDLSTGFQEMTTKGAPNKLNELAGDLSPRDLDVLR